MRLSSYLSVARFKAHDLKHFLIVSGLISFHAPRIQFTIVWWGGSLEFPAEVHWLIPFSVNLCSHFSIQGALKSLSLLTSGACIYFVHPPGTIQTSILFTESKDFIASSI